MPWPRPYTRPITSKSLGWDQYLKKQHQLSRWVPRADKVGTQRAYLGSTMS